eukprot:g2204.t1
MRPSWLNAKRREQRAKSVAPGDRAKSVARSVVRQLWLWQDLTREDPAFVGWEAIKKYQEETKENTPSNMRFVLDEMTEGVKVAL